MKVEGGPILTNSVAASFRRRCLKHQVVFIVLAALFVRLAIVVCGFRAQAVPSVDHAEFGWEMGWVARSIFLGHGFSSPFFPTTGATAIVPPLFPFLLADIFRMFGLYTAKAAFAILSVSSLFSALTCIPIYLSARYALGEQTAAMAGWGWAICPYAIYFSAARVWDYALTGLLFTSCFYFAQRLHRETSFRVWSGFGLLYGFTALANPSVLPMFPAFLLMAVLPMRRASQPWLGQCVISILSVLAMLAPWTIHNYRTLHFVGPVRDNFWLECWAGNNGDTFESNAVWAHPASNPLEMQRYEAGGEMAYMAEKKVLAVRFIERYPLFFAGLSIRRAFSYWTGFWSLKPAYLSLEPLEIPDMFYCTGVTVLMLLGARRFWRQDRALALPYLVLITFFPLTYYFTHASPDYRQPIEPEIIVMVAVGILSLKQTEEPMSILEDAVHADETQLTMSMSAEMSAEVS
jgi:4-amino-4-deoxy-L-arabinose transferase-like glycosyltransferase